MTDTVASLRGVRVSYGARPAIDGIDLDVRAGERVALVGPSGAGKTTVLRTCNGTIVPTAGHVTVLGHDFTVASGGERRAVRRRIGTVYQQLHLVGPLRVVHNVNAGRLAEWSGARALRSLVRPVEVDAVRDALARVGIADKIFERTERLSGGEQQRVALARVLRQDPELILADEPVSSLDPARAEEVMDLLCGVVAGGARTLIVSLHDFGLARRRCDRIVGLRAGRIVFDLPAAAVDEARGADLYRITG
jgi:phosphonate transport system ATP-binding protein